MDELDYLLDMADKAIETEKKIAATVIVEEYMGGPMQSLVAENITLNPSYTNDMARAWQIEGEEGMEASNDYRRFKGLPLIEFDDGK